MMIQTIGFEGKTVQELTDKINYWFAHDPRANGIEFVDVKYTCANMVDSLPGFGSTNNLVRSALVVYKVL